MGIAGYSWFQCRFPSHNTWSQCVLCKPHPKSSTMKWSHSLHFGGFQCLRLFLPATQIHLLELPPADPNRLMDLLRPRFSGVSRDFKNYTQPASVNVLFLSLNELETDTLSFEFRPQIRHQSLNVPLGGSIFYYAV